MFRILSQKKDNIALICGGLDSKTMEHLKQWALDMRVDCVQNPVLVIDASGGDWDLGLFLDLLQLPLHIHVAGNAAGFAAALALTGSVKTISPEGGLVLYAPEWGSGLHPEERFVMDFRLHSLLSSLAPKNIKDILLKAVSEGKIYAFDSEVLGESELFDVVSDYSGRDLGLAGDCEIWYDEIYGQEEGY